MTLELQIRKIEPDIQVAALKGRMSLGQQLATTEKSLKSLIAEGAKKLILDLSELTYVDSSGVGVMVTLFGSMVKSGGQLRMAAPTEVVQKVITITQLHRIIPIDADLATAIRHLS